MKRCAQHTRVQAETHALKLHSHIQHLHTERSHIRNTHTHTPVASAVTAAEVDLWAGICVRVVCVYVCVCVCVCAWYLGSCLKPP